MKLSLTKWLSVLLCAALLLCGLVACQNNDDQSIQPETQTEEPTEVPPTLPSTPESEPAPNVEVIYSSCTVEKDEEGLIWASPIILFKNNDDVTAYLGTLTVDLEKESGDYTGTVGFIMPYPTILQPGEIAVATTKSVIKLDPGDEKTLSVVPYTDFKKSELECIRFEVDHEETLSYNEETGEIICSGTVKNNTDKSCFMCYVAVNLFDKDNLPIGQTVDVNTDELKPGETRPFSFAVTFANADLSFEDIASFEIYAFPFQAQF